MADPAAPTDIGIDSTYRIDGNRASVIATVTWVPVADVDFYDVEWTTDRDSYAAEWVPSVVAVVPPTRIAGLPPDGLLTVRVRSCSGTARSAWLDSVQTQLARDANPPPAPSAPNVRPTLGGMAITWDGLDGDGEPMPADFYYAEVHVGTTPTFSPAAATLADSYQLRGGATSVQGLQTDVDYYVALVGYDFALNASYPSVAGTARPRLLSADDLPAEVITGDKIADGTLRVSSLTAVGGGLVPNSNFEESIRGVLPAQPARWYPEADSLPAELDTVTALNGSQSFRMAVTSGLGTSYLSAIFPVTAGESLYATASLKSSRRATRDSIQLAIVSGATTEIVTGEPSPQQIVTDVYRGTAGTVAEVVEGQVRIPAGHRFATVRLAAAPDGTALPFSVWWDAVDVWRVRGSVTLAAGSVGVEELATGAVTDDAVSDVSIGKVRDGTLAADVALAGRIAVGGLELGQNGLVAVNAAGARTISIGADGSGQFVGRLSTGLEPPSVTAGSEISTPDPDPAPGLLIEGRIDPIPRTQPAISVRRSDGTLCLHSYQDGETTPVASVEMAPTSVRMRTAQPTGTHDSIIEIESDRVNVNGWHVWPARLDLGALAANTVYTGRLPYGGTAGTFGRISPSMLMVTVESSGPIAGFSYGDYAGNTQDFAYRLATGATAVTAALCCLVAYSA